MSNVTNAIISPAASQAPPRLGDVAIAQYCTATGRIFVQYRSLQNQWIIGSAG